MAFQGRRLSWRPDKHDAPASESSAWLRVQTHLLALRACIVVQVVADCVSRQPTWGLAKLVPRCSTPATRRATDRKSRIIPPLAMK